MQRILDSRKFSRLRGWSWSGLIGSLLLLFIASPAAAGESCLTACTAAVIPGDANADGAVDGLDVAVVRQKILGAATALRPDCTDDSVVDVLDLICITSRILDPPSLDSDGDGLTDLDEVVAGTDPTRPDTDGDEVCDGLELNTYGTDPNLADSDGDGISDGAELAACSDPLDASDSPLAVSFALADSTVAEEAGAVAVRLLFNRPTPAGLTLTWRYGGSATQGEDYAGPPGLLSVPENSTEMVIQLQLIDDREFESREWISLAIEDPAAGDFFVASPAQHRLAIDDNDRLWEASLKAGSEDVTLTLEIRQDGSGDKGRVLGGAGGIVPVGPDSCLSRDQVACWQLSDSELSLQPQPDGSYSGELRLRLDSHSQLAGVAGLLLPAGATLFDSDSSRAFLGFELKTAGCATALLSPTLIQGCLDLTLGSSVHPHLSTTLSGSFTLSPHPDPPNPVAVTLCEEPPCE